MPEQDSSRGYADVSRFRGLDHRDDDGAGLMALELGGSTVFDDSAASRRHSNVSFGEPPVVAQYPPSPSVLSTPQSVERYRRRSASRDSSNAVNPIQLSASHFHMAQILATKMPPIGAAANVRLKEGPK